jgi:dTDP-4-amino-4,6-dideoxygalactose transaminase
VQQSSSAILVAPEKKTTTKESPAFPFLDLKAQYESIRQEVTKSVLETLESQRFILGPDVAAFEKEICEKYGCSSAIGCASGSDALLLALMALEVGPGDEVITTPFTFVATIGSIVRLGAKPVFVDIDPETYNLNVENIEAVISDRTRAIMPVHLFGCSADLDPLLKIANARGIAVVEDAAQAIGAKYHNRAVGNIGTFGCFSFFPSKNLGGAGDGGLVSTNDPELADRLRVLRTHGSRQRYSYEVIGMNSRLDTLQATILRVKLRHLDSWAEGRRCNAERYEELIKEFGLSTKIKTPVAPAYAYHVYNQYTIRASDRDALRSHLTSRGVPTEIYYPSPLHIQPAFSYLGFKSGDFPQAEQASNEVVSLPIYPELPAENQRSVVQAIAEFYNRA